MLRSIFQTSAWGHFKARSGWAVRTYGDVLALERNIGFGRQMLYFPELPFESVSADLIQRVRSENAQSRIFSRFEPLEKWSAEAAHQLKEFGLVKSFEDVQPEYRQWVYLEGSEDDVLSRMKPKGRYNIRVAQRNNLDVRWDSSEPAVAKFYSLYSNTSRRTGFRGRGEAYFQRLVKVIANEGWGGVITVESDGEPLSSAIVSFYGEIASYLYGGSGGDRSLMAPYLMHWEIIREAKKRNCRVYDLLAVAPLNAPNHPHSGLSRFKSQFGGEAVRLMGSWDLVHSPFWYTLYRLAQKRRRRAVS